MLQAKTYQISLYSLAKLWGENKKWAIFETSCVYVVTIYLWRDVDRSLIRDR